jgi:hypothetical protein
MGLCRGRLSAGPGQANSLRLYAEMRTPSFEADAMAAEVLLGSPSADLPSRMQRFARPFRQLAIRFIRVYWVQQLGVDRAILAAVRALRRETRDEIASLRAEVEKLRDQINKQSR